MIKKTLTMLLAVAALGYAQTKGFAQLNYQTKSIVSGFTPSKTPVAQTTFGFTNHGLTINSWVDYALERKNVRELDVSASGKISVSDAVSISGYVGYFMFPQSANHDAQEFGITPSVTMHGFSLSNYISKICGIGSGNGFITKTTLSKEFMVGDFHIKPSTQIVYNGGYFTSAKGFSHTSVSLDARCVVDDITLVGKVYAQKPLADHFNGTFKKESFVSLGIEKEL